MLRIDKPPHLLQHISSPRVHDLLPRSGVAAPMRLGRPKELGGLGPAKNGFAQEGGGPVIEGIHGSMEVASS
jgi:hypothetical protein